MSFWDFWTIFFKKLGFGGLGLGLGVAKVRLPAHWYILSRTPFYQFHKEHPKNTKFRLSITQKPFIEFLWNFYNFIQFGWWKHGLILASNSNFCSESWITYIGTGKIFWIFFWIFFGFFFFFSLPRALASALIYTLSHWMVIYTVLAQKWKKLKKNEKIKKPLNNLPGP